MPFSQRFNNERDENDRLEKERYMYFLNPKDHKQMTCRLYVRELLPELKSRGEERISSKVL